MKVCIGIPTNRGVKAKTLEALLKMVAKEKEELCIIVATEGHTVAENRNYIATQSLRNKCDYLLFVDDDMVFPEDTLEKLLAHDKHIVGVNSHSRVLPLKTTVKGDLGETLSSVEVVGTGILLVKTDVFKKISQPHFQFGVTDFGWTFMGEDAWFCKKAKECGFGIWCDPTIEVKHIGDYLY